MNERIKNYEQFIREFAAFRRNIRSKYNDEFRGFKFRFSMMNTKNILVERINDMIDRRPRNQSDMVMLNEDHLKNFILCQSRDLNRSEMFTVITRRLNDDDIYDIESVKIVLPMDHLFQLIAMNYDKLDELLDYYQLIYRHEIGHVLDAMSYIGMSFNDYDVYARELVCQHDLTVLKKVKNGELDSQFVSGVGLVIEGVPLHYHMMHEIAANRKAEFTEEELQRFINYASGFFDH